MKRRSGFQCVGKKLLRLYISIIASGAFESPEVARCGFLSHAREHFLLALSKLIHVVHEIDQQELLGERLRKGWLHAKRELASAELEITVALVIVHHGLVIELRRANTEAVVGIE